MRIQQAARERRGIRGVHLHEMLAGKSLPETEVIGLAAPYEELLVGLSIQARDGVSGASIGRAGDPEKIAQGPLGSKTPHARAPPRPAKSIERSQQSLNSADQECPVLASRIKIKRLKQRYES